MCAITQSFVEEGKIIGVVEYMKNVLHKNDEEVMKEIKEYFQLSDYQARTFIYPKESASA